MEPWQAVLISAAVSATAVFTTYYLGRRERRIERKTDHAEWVGEVNADRKWIKSSVEAIKGEIEAIKGELSRVQETLSEIVGYMLEGALTRSSPLQLTEFGKKISSDLNARSWSTRLSDSGQLNGEIQGMSHDEVEKFCLNFVLTRLNPSEQERRTLEGCARENGISVSGVRRVLAVERRDTLLEIRRENSR